VAVDLEAQREKLLERFPVTGRLAVEFRSQRRPPENSRPLPKQNFTSVWSRFVSPLLANFAHILPPLCRCTIALNAAGKGRSAPLRVSLKTRQCYIISITPEISSSSFKLDLRAYELASRYPSAGFGRGPGVIISDIVMHWSCLSF
jgi:hypothetical protein